MRRPESGKDSKQLTIQGIIALPRRELNTMKGSAIADNEDSMLEIIKERWFVFKFASDRLKSDKAFILKALKINGNIWPFISDDSKQVQSLFLSALSSEKPLYSDDCYPCDLKKHFLIDQQVVVKIISCYPHEFKIDKSSTVPDFLFEFSEQFRQNEAVVTEAAKHDVHLLHYAADGLKNNKVFMLGMIGEDFRAISHVGKELLFDKDIEGLVQKRAEKSLSLLDKPALTFYRDECEKLKHKSDAIQRQYVHILRQAKAHGSKLTMLPISILFKIAVATADIFANNRVQSAAIAASIFNFKTSGTTEETTTTNKIASRVKKIKLA